MELKQKEDFKGRIAKRVNLTNEENMSVTKMMSTIIKGDEGINKYFEEKRERPIQEHKSMLDEFQL